MQLKQILPAIGLSLALGASPIAFAQTSAGAAGTGSATATNSGATAGGAVAGKATVDKRSDRHNKRDRRDRTYTQPSANSATTYGSGASYTDRDSTSAAVTSGGAASGTGVQSTTSTVDAYGETTRNGTSTDIYGNSTATSGQTPR
ncbi:MAG: hypothetical protein V4656_01990 [Pseudomonadota bacterium]